MAPVLEEPPFFSKQNTGSVRESSVNESSSFVCDEGFFFFFSFAVLVFGSWMAEDASAGGCGRLDGARVAQSTL